MQVTFYLFTHHHTAVERILLARLLLSQIELCIRTTNINL